jgi:hypothetical protein
MPHRRHGKVAQLPRAIREHVNGMLDDGQTYSAVIAWLDANGHPGLNHDNLAAWFEGGFQDWLQHQDHLSELEKLRELAIDVARENDGSKTQEAAIHIGAALIYQVLLKFNPAKLAERMDVKPEHFTTLMNAFTRLNRRTNELDMLKEYLRQEAERRQQELERKLNVGEPKGLSDEAADAMESRLKLT